MKTLVLALTCLLVSISAPAQTKNGEESAIRETLTAQAAAWNRGDIPHFMQAYENSADTTFIGTQLRKGYEPILKRYLHAYTSSAQMGTLTFSEVEVQLLPSSCGKTEYALVTGRFHLQRKERGSATKDDGIFSLVWHKGAHGWKILLDHTS